MKFSVIIPLYNKAPYVAKAIRSVLSQTFTDYELIIVDDGSTDQSAEIALQIIGTLDNCQLINQANAGVSVARNNGVAVSNGEFLCFLDADDWWEPTFLEEMTKLIAEFPDAGIYGTNYTIVNETRHKTRVAKIGVDDGFEKGYINYCQVYAKTLNMPLWTGAVCIPRKVFEEMQGFPEGIKLGEDFLLWIRIALEYKVAFLNKPQAYYNQDVDSVTRATHGLTPPEYNFLWHIAGLSEYEQINSDYKTLIDRLRAYDLQPYYLSRDYHQATLIELKKVEQTNISQAIKRFYSYPLALARLLVYVRRAISAKMKGIKMWVDELASEKWEVGAIEEGINGIMEGRYQIRWLKPKYQDRWFADPFILDVNETSIVLLVEEYLYDQKKGRIAELGINRKDMRIVSNKTLLEKTTHLSFPAILRTDGKVYVYPENSAEFRLVLYEYNEGSLLQVGTISDEPLTDAIITNLFHDDRIYATKMPDPNGNEIGLYRRENPCGKYVFNSGLMFKGKDARMAGDFFEYKGLFYKPSQDCNGRYGKAINLYETDDGLDFHLHSTLSSTHPKLREGMHTLNSYKGIAVVDVVGYKHPFAGRLIRFFVSLKKRIKR